MSGAQAALKKRLTAELESDLKQLTLGVEKEETALMWLVEEMLKSRAQKGQKLLAIAAIEAEIKAREGAVNARK